jgi:hypothetical protein
MHHTQTQRERERDQIHTYKEKRHKENRKKKQMQSEMDKMGETFKDIKQEHKLKEVRENMEEVHILRESIKGKKEKQRQ